MEAASDAFLKALVPIGEAGRAPMLDGGGSSTIISTRTALAVLAELHPAQSCIEIDGGA